MHFNQRKKIFLLGSSMTERSFSLDFHGWGASLSNWYARSADVLNRGAGGYNSRWLRMCLPRLLGNEVPDVTVLFIGNNDAIQETESQHVPVQEYKENILYILGKLYDVKPSMVVLLVTTTRVNEQLKPLQKDSRRAEYAEVLRFLHRNRSRPDILGTERIPQNMGLVDLWGGGDGDTGDCHDPAQHLHKYHVTAQDLHDGLHLDISGNRKVFAALKDVINSQFPHLSPDFAKQPCSAGVPPRKRSASICAVTTSGTGELQLHQQQLTQKRAKQEQMSDEHRHVLAASSPRSTHLRKIDIPTESGKENHTTTSTPFSSPTSSAMHKPFPLELACEGAPPEPQGVSETVLKSQHHACQGQNQRQGQSQGHSHSDERDPPLQWTVPRWRSLV